MKNSLFPELEQAISGLCSKLGIEVNNTLQQEYQNGMHPNLLSYEKVESSPITIPAIQKYLIGAKTILNQPCQYYDINRACRHYFFIQILNRAIESNINSVSNYEERFEKLLKETKFDPFDSIMYELAVSGTYSSSPAINNVKFIGSKSNTAPEFEFTHKHKQIYVECKKFDRSSDIVSKIRDEVRSKAQLTLHSFKKINRSALIEVSFHIEPTLISETLILQICLEALKNRNTIVDKSLTVSVIPLHHQKLENYVLFPSPMYYWQRYGFRNHGEWFGLTSLIEAQHGYFKDIVNEGIPFASTWLDDAKFECVLKWKITDENILWRYRRLGYKLLFKGLEQLQSHGNNSILHAWYERDGSAGHRQDELLDFFSRLDESKRDIFSWIIFNETILDTSVNGIFDLIEHAHPISGPTANYKHPIATSVFTSDQEFATEGGEFGAGPVLPDIDEIYDKKIG